MKPSTLPRSLDDLRGLRAARWIRVSTTEQGDNYGPDSQRERQDRAIERHELIDTGLAWELAHSGYATDAEGIAKIASDPRYQDMLSRAGHDYDVLLIGYVSRANRNTELQMMTRRLLHNSGAVILACDERMLSTDPQWAREAADAETYSAKLAINISLGYEAKWRRYSDPAGWSPLGYRRGAERPHLLEIDPETIGPAVTLYERYALGNTSMDRLAEAGIAVVQHGPRKGLPMTREGIADVLANPVYRGVVRYKGEERERPDLRAIPDELWYRVQYVQASRVSGGGPHRCDRVDLLAGVLYCVCGTRVRSDGYAKKGNPRKRHPGPCDSWGSAERLYAATWERPIVEQVSKLDLSDSTIAQVQAALGAPPPMADDLGRRRIERDRRKLREAFDAGHVNASEFVAQAALLEQALEALHEAPAAPQGPSGIEAESYLRELAATWSDANEQERADVLHAIYERIEVAGPQFVGIALTPEAERHGLALALPEEVTIRSDAALACPRGLEPPTFRSAT